VSYRTIRNMIWAILASLLAWEVGMIIYRYFRH
jgi:hypothetical protein